MTDSTLNTPPNDKDTRDFLKRVVPWPASPEEGYINVHWHLPGKPFRGRSTQNIDELVEAVAALKASDPSNIYFCLSHQRRNGGSRSKANALKLQSVWMDIDVKDDPKHYNTFEEADAGIAAFVEHARLPSPSAITESGGGRHVYWFSDIPLPVAEWLQYAEGLKAAAKAFGLKCDLQVIADAARVLRVPGTKNFKSDPPRDVKLAPGSTLVTYNFATELVHLIGGGPVIHGKVAPAFSHLDAKVNLDARLERGYPPLDPRLIFMGCPWLRTAFETGGKDYSEPEWKLSILCATFMQKGNAIVHKIGNKHPGYTPESTEAVWARKLRERSASGRKLGWPSCSAIFDAGSRDCKACPHFGKIKSPLHLALPTPTVDVATIFNQVKQGKLSPVAALMTLRDQGADIDTLLAAMNQTYAVVKYGGQIMIAIITGDDISFMKDEDFHKMFANLIVYVETKGKEGAAKTHAVKLSKHWFDWKERRQYLGRGVVFEPGGPLETPNNMLNLWRGFGVVPKPGDWPLMRTHIFSVVCSGDRKLFDYLIKWMAYAVQHPDKPIGVAIAFLGPQGAGKGVVARTFGSFFGKHFVHITHGDQLTSRFNASLGTSCAVFLDEALWAGDKRGEGTLKALITEPTFQMEAKFRDPIAVQNRLRLMVASNNDWAVPAGVGDRRWFVLNVAETYAGIKHRDYWTALYGEVENGGAAAMLHDLLATDLSGFDVRAIPHTVAKAQQQAHSFRGPTAWLYDILQEGAVEYNEWNEAGLIISKESAYERYKEFSKERREWQPEIKDVWSKQIRRALGPCIEDTRQTTASEARVRWLKLAPLADCRRQFETYVGASIEWGPPDVPAPAKDTTVSQTAEDVGDPTTLDTEHDAPDIEWEPEPEDWPDYELDCEPEDETEGEFGSK